MNMADLTPVQRAIRASDARFIPELEKALRRCTNDYQRAIRCSRTRMRLLNSTGSHQRFIRQTDFRNRKFRSRIKACFRQKYPQNRC